MTSMTAFNFNIADLYDGDARREALALDCIAIDNDDSGIVHMAIGEGDPDDSCTLMGTHVATPTSGEMLEKTVIRMIIEAQHRFGVDGEWVIVSKRRAAGH